MGVLKDRFIQDYNLVSTGSRGWMISHSNQGLYCPQCGNSDGTRLAFIFSEEGVSSFHCVKCSYSCRLEKFLWKMKISQYITKYKEVKKEDIINKKDLSKTNKNNIDLSELPEVTLPLFFKRLKYSNYLKNRGAKLNIYKEWTIGMTTFETDLKGYVIFVIPENGRNVGWVARNQYSKKYIDEYNKTHNRKILRWKNSECDFGKIVFGLDEITENTKTLIIVEGITSKLRIDCELELYNKEDIKCCCTFGKKTTQTQLQKIKNKANNINKLILFYDSDAVNQTKKTSYEYKELFNNVLIAFCNYKDEEGNYKDAGDLNKEELLDILKDKNLKSPFYFYNNNMEKKSLFKR